VDREIRQLIREMSSANSLWGAPRIHGELLKLGIEISQATVAKYMVPRPGTPSQTWRGAGFEQVEVEPTRTYRAALLRPRSARNLSACRAQVLLHSGQTNPRYKGFDSAQPAPISNRPSLSLHQAIETAPWSSQCPWCV